MKKIYINWWTCTFFKFFYSYFWLRHALFYPYPYDQEREQLQLHIFSSHLITDTWNSLQYCILPNFSSIRRGSYYHSLQSCRFNERGSYGPRYIKKKVRPRQLNLLLCFDDVTAATQWFFSALFCSIEAWLYLWYMCYYL